MKRSELIKRLVSEGLSEKTLANFSDKQIIDLSKRLIGEALTATMADIKKSPELQAASKDPNTPIRVVGEEKPSAGKKKLSSLQRKKMDTDKDGDIDSTDLKNLRNKKEMKESKPSAGLSKEKKSEVVKKAIKGKNIGKKGKNFKKIEKKGEKSGVKDPKAVAAAAMWKNIKRESTEVENWIKGLVESNYHSFTSKKEIMGLINEKLESKVPEFLTFDSIVNAGNPQREPEETPVETPVDPDVDPGEPLIDPTDPFRRTRPVEKPGPKAFHENKKNASK